MAKKNKKRTFLLGDNNKFTEITEDPPKEGSFNYWEEPQFDPKNVKPVAHQPVAQQANTAVATAEPAAVNPYDAQADLGAAVRRKELDRELGLVNPQLSPSAQAEFDAAARGDIPGWQIKNPAAREAFIKARQKFPNFGKRRQEEVSETFAGLSPSQKMHKSNLIMAALGGDVEWGSESEKQQAMEFLAVPGNKEALLGERSKVKTEIDEIRNQSSGKGTRYGNQIGDVKINNEEARHRERVLDRLAKQGRRGIKKRAEEAKKKRLQKSGPTSMYSGGAGSPSFDPFTGQRSGLSVGSPSMTPDRKGITTDQTPPGYFTLFDQEKDAFSGTHIPDPLMFSESQFGSILQFDAETTGIGGGAGRLANNIKSIAMGMGFWDSDTQKKWNELNNTDFSEFAPGPERNAAIQAVRDARTRMMRDVVMQMRENEAGLAEGRFDELEGAQKEFDRDITEARRRAERAKAKEMGLTPSVNDMGQMLGWLDQNDKPAETPPVTPEEIQEQYRQMQREKNAESIAAENIKKDQITTAEGQSVDVSEIVDNPEVAEVPVGKFKLGTPVAGMGGNEHTGSQFEDWTGRTRKIKVAKNDGTSGMVEIHAAVVKDDEIANLPEGLPYIANNTLHVSGSTWKWNRQAAEFQSVDKPDIRQSQPEEGRLFSGTKIDEPQTTEQNASDNPVLNPFGTVDKTDVDTQNPQEYEYTPEEIRNSNTVFKNLKSEYGSAAVGLAALASEQYEPNLPEIDSKMISNLSKMGYELISHTGVDGSVAPVGLTLIDMRAESEDGAFFDPNTTNNAAQRFAQTKVYKDALAAFKKFEEARPKHRSARYSYNEGYAIPEAKAWQKAAQKLLVSIIGDKHGPWRLSFYNDAEDVEENMWATTGNLKYLGD